MLDPACFKIGSVHSPPHPHPAKSGSESGDIRHQFNCHLIEKIDVSTLPVKVLGFEQFDVAPPVRTHPTPSALQTERVRPRTQESLRIEYLYIYICYKKSMDMLSDPGL